MEQLTDDEKRLFLAAMARELKVCVEVDKKNMSGPVSCEHICNEIIRKVKAALWN